MVGLTIMSQQFFLSSQDFPGIEVAEASMRQRKERDRQGCYSHWLIGLKLCNHHLIYGQRTGATVCPLALLSFQLSPLVFYYQE